MLPPGATPCLELLPSVHTCAAHLDRIERPQVQCDAGSCHLQGRRRRGCEVLSGRLCYAAVRARERRRPLLAASRRRQRASQRTRNAERPGSDGPRLRFVVGAGCEPATSDFGSSPATATLKADNAPPAPTHPAVPPNALPSASRPRSATAPGTLPGQVCLPVPLVGPPQVVRLRGVGAHEDNEQATPLVQRAGVVNRSRIRWVSARGVR
jgi:hypothetical protein